MSAPEIEEAEVVEVGRSLAVRPAVTLVPQTTAAELVQRLDVIRGAMETAMQKDVDYGVIPGTGKKPTLLKPGAEKLAVLFQLDVQLENEKMWGDDGHLTVVSKATVFHIPSGARVASGEGICTTREGKYAYRNLDRACPACGAAAIIKGREDFGGGWLCWKNHKTTPGCGRKYAENDPAIVDQKTGKMPNDNLADTYNTVDKMASKRARVDAVLAATGASALFTQDAEDLPKESPPVDADLGPEEDRRFPPADEPVPGRGGEPATDAQKKKLNVLVGKLRPDHVSTLQLWQGMGREPVPSEDGTLHWSPLRDSLTRDQAHALIERLVALEEKVAEGSEFAARAAEAQAARAEV